MAVITEFPRSRVRVEPDRSAPLFRIPSPRAIIERLQNQRVREQEVDDLESLFCETVDNVLGTAAYRHFTVQRAPEYLPSGSAWLHYKDLPVPTVATLRRKKNGDIHFRVSSKDYRYQMNLEPNGKLTFNGRYPQGQEKPRPLYRDELEEYAALLRFTREMLLFVASNMSRRPPTAPVA